MLFISRSIENLEGELHLPMPVIPELAEGKLSAKKLSRLPDVVEQLEIAVHEWNVHLTTIVEESDVKVYNYW